MEYFSANAAEFRKLKEKIRKEEEIVNFFLAMAIGFFVTSVVMVYLRIYGFMD